MKLSLLAVVWLLPSVAFGANRPPTISGLPTTIAPVGAQYAFTPMAADADGNALSFSILNRPSWATFDSHTGRLAGIPTGAHVGTYYGIVITVSDGQASARSPEFLIAVTGNPGTTGGVPTNRPPSISGLPTTTAPVGTQYAFTPMAADADGNALSFSILNQPSWATFDTRTGQLAGTPTGAHVGNYDGIVITVSDGQAWATTPMFGISVTGSLGTANRAPMIFGTPAASVLQGNPYVFQPTAMDPDGDALTFWIDNAPFWATFNPALGRLQAVTSASDVGTYSNIVLGVSDGKTTTSLEAFSITVRAFASGSAVLTWMPPTQNVDGSPLTDLAGFRVYWGSADSGYTNSVSLNTAGQTSYVIENLVPGGTYSFAVSALNARGLEGELSDPMAVTIH